MKSEIITCDNCGKEIEWYDVWEVIGNAHHDFCSKECIEAYEKSHVSF